MRPKLPYAGWLTARPWERLALGLWLFIIVAACGRVLLLPHASPGTYPIYVKAGRCWLAGESAYPSQDGRNIYRYSPTCTIFFATLTTFPDAMGNALWRLLNVAFYLGGLAYWGRVAVPQTRATTARGAEPHPNDDYRALLFLLVVPLSVSSLVNAQCNALLIGLLLIAMSAVVSKRWTLAAVCLSTATLLKVYPLVAGLLLLLLYPRRFAARFALALMVGLGLPFLFQHPSYVADQYATWFRLLAGDNDRTSWELIDRYRDLRLLIDVWFTPIGAGVYHEIQLAAGMTIAGSCWLLQWRARKSETLGPSAPAAAPKHLLTALGLLCCWMTVFGPATEANTYILVAPTLAWCMLEAWTMQRSRIYRLVISSSYAIFTVAQAAIWFPHVREFHSLGPHPFAGLLLFTALVGSAMREGITERSATKKADKPAAAKAA